MRTITTLVATAALICGAPALAADGTLTYGGKTVPVYDVSGGNVFETIDVASDPDGGLLLQPVTMEVDAGGFIDLLPLVDIVLKNGNEWPNLTLNADDEIHSLIGVVVSKVEFPACDGQSAKSERILVELSAHMIKSAPAQSEARSMPLAVTPALALRPLAGAPLIACTIAVEGPQAQVKALTSSITIEAFLDNPGVGELRDYDAARILPYVGVVPLSSKPLKLWAREVLIKGEDTKANVRITYTTASGPALMLTYPQASPIDAAMVGGDVIMKGETVSITKP